MKGLNSDCVGSCAYVGAIIVHGSQKQYSQLYNKAKNKNHPVCKSMSKDIDTIRGRISKVAELAYGPDVLKNTEAKASCLDCANKLNNEDEFLNTFSDLISEMNEQSQCYNLKSDEEKKVFSGTGLDKDYSLKRDDDGIYSVPLNLQFVADEDYNGEIEPDKVPEHFMNEVQKCINKANEKMLGPNGEQLKIVIHGNERECQVGRPKKIKIGSTDYRSNSKKYESDIDCPTIVHEVLHLLGLCDEYAEQSMGFYMNSETEEKKTKLLNSIKDNKELMNNEKYRFKLAFDCRTTVIGDSIMSHQYDRWHHVFKRNDYSSLLTPGQFNAILYGTCEKKNKLFNECSQLAYQNSVDTSDVDCMKKKHQCERQNFSGADKQKQMKRFQTLLARGNESRNNLLQRLRKEQEKEEPDIAMLGYLRDSLQWREEALKDITEKLEIIEAWP